MKADELLKEADLYARVMSENNYPDVASVIVDLTTAIREEMSKTRKLEVLVVNDLRGIGPAMSVSHDGSVLTIARMRTDGSFAFDETHVDFDGTDAGLLRAAIDASLTALEES